MATKRSALGLPLVSGWAPLGTGKKAPIPGSPTAPGNWGTPSHKTASRPRRSFRQLAPAQPLPLHTAARPPRGQRWGSGCSGPLGGLLQPLPALGSGLSVKTWMAHRVFTGLWCMLLCHLNCPIHLLRSWGLHGCSRLESVMGPWAPAPLSPPPMLGLHSFLKSLITQSLLLYLALCVKVITMFQTQKLREREPGRAAATRQEDLAVEEAVVPSPDPWSFHLLPHSPWFACSVGGGHLGGSVS